MTTIIKNLNKAIACVNGENMSEYEENLSWDKLKTLKLGKINTAIGVGSGKYEGLDFHIEIDPTCLSKMF